MTPRRRARENPWESPRTPVRRERLRRGATPGRRRGPAIRRQGHSRPQARGRGRHSGEGVARAARATIPDGTAPRRAGRTAGRAPGPTRHAGRTAGQTPRPTRRTHGPTTTCTAPLRWPGRWSHARGGRRDARGGRENGHRPGPGARALPRLRPHPPRRPGAPGTGSEPPCSGAGQAHAAPPRPGRLRSATRGRGRAVGPTSAVPAAGTEDDPARSAVSARQEHRGRGPPGRSPGPRRDCSRPSPVAPVRQSDLGGGRHRVPDTVGAP